MGGLTQRSSHLPRKMGNRLPPKTPQIAWRTWPAKTVAECKTWDKGLLRIELVGTCDCCRHACMRAPCRRWGIGKLARANTKVRSAVRERTCQRFRGDCIRIGAREPWWKLAIAARRKASNIPSRGLESGLVCRPVPCARTRLVAINILATKPMYWHGFPRHTHTHSFCHLEAPNLENKSTPWIAHKEITEYAQQGSTCLVD